MTTQNLEYSEDVKAFPLVKSAFDARDDVQERIDEVTERMNDLRGRLENAQESLDAETAILAIADDKLALLATMAQGQLDEVEKVKDELGNIVKMNLDVVYDRVQKSINEIKDQWIAEETNETTFSDAIEELISAFSIRVNMDGEIDEDTDNSQEAYDLVP